MRARARARESVQSANRIVKVALTIFKSDGNILPLLKISNAKETDIMYCYAEMNEQFYFLLSARLFWGHYENGIFFCSPEKRERHSSVLPENEETSDLICGESSEFKTNR